MPVTQSGSRPNSLQTMIDAGRMQHEYKLVLAALVDNRELSEHTGQTWHEVDKNKIVAQDISETTELSNYQEFTDSLFSITPTISGTATFVLDEADSVASTEAIGDEGARMIAALQRKMEVDGLVVFDSFTNSLGGAGSVLTRGHIAAAVTENAKGGTSGGDDATNEPWQGPQCAVLESRQIYDLDVEVMAGLGTYPIPKGMTEEVFKAGFRAADVGGASLWKSDLISIDSSDDAKGAVFARGKGGAIVLVRAPYTDRSIREVRNEKRGGGGMERYAYTKYGWGKRKDAWGREIYTDAMTVTS